MRRLLFFLASVTMGGGLLIILSAGNGAGKPFGIAFWAVIVLGGALGGWWGRGPIAKGVPAPQLTRAGLSVAMLCVVAGVLLLWRPAVGNGLPLWPFLACMAVSGLLLASVGRMGHATA